MTNINMLNKVTQLLGLKKQIIDFKNNLRCQGD
jgi:hypothetical protein